MFFIHRKSASLIIALFLLASCNPTKSNNIQEKNHPTKPKLISQSVTFTDVPQGQNTMLLRYSLVEVDKLEEWHTNLAKLDNNSFYDASYLTAPSGHMTTHQAGLESWQLFIDTGEVIYNGTSSFVGRGGVSTSPTFNGPFREDDYDVIKSKIDINRPFYVVWSLVLQQDYTVHSVIPVGPDSLYQVVHQIEKSQDEILSEPISPSVGMESFITSDANNVIISGLPSNIISSSLQYTFLKSTMRSAWFNTIHQNPSFMTLEEAKATHQLFQAHTTREEVTLESSSFLNGDVTLNFTDLRVSSNDLGAPLLIRENEYGFYSPPMNLFNSLFSNEYDLQPLNITENSTLYIGWVLLNKHDDGTVTLFPLNEHLPMQEYSVIAV